MAAEAAGDEQRHINFLASLDRFTAAERHVAVERILRVWVDYKTAAPVHREAASAFIFDRGSGRCFYGSKGVDVCGRIEEPIDAARARLERLCNICRDAGVRVYITVYEFTPRGPSSERLELGTPF